MRLKQDGGDRGSVHESAVAVPQRHIRMDITNQIYHLHLVVYVSTLGLLYHVRLSFHAQT